MNSDLISAKEEIEWAKGVVWRRFFLLFRGIPNNRRCWVHLTRDHLRLLRAHRLEYWHLSWLGWLEGLVDHDWSLLSRLEGLAHKDWSSLSSDDLWSHDDVGTDDLSIADHLVRHWVFNSLEVLEDDVLDLVRVDDGHGVLRDLHLACCGELEHGERGALSDLADSSLSDHRARSVSGARVGNVVFTWLLDLLDVLSAVVSSESESLVAVVSSAASSPAGPVPLAAITHIALDSFISKNVRRISNAESLTDGSTVAVSSSGLGSHSAGNSAGRPR